MSLNDEIFGPADEVQKGTVKKTWTIAHHNAALLLGCKSPSVVVAALIALGKTVLSIPAERWPQFAQFFKPADMQTVELQSLLANFHILRKKKKERGDDLGIYKALEPGHDELIRRMLQAADDGDASFFKALIKAIKPRGGKIGWTLTQSVCLQFEKFYMQNSFEPTKQQLRELVKRSGTKMSKRNFTRILSKTGLDNLEEGPPGPLPRF